MITKDQVLDKTLAQFLDDGRDFEKDYMSIKRLVATALFSRLPERREYSKRTLIEYFQKLVGIETITEDGILSVYINFNNVPKYILVDRYKENGPIFEIIPTKDKMEKWKQVQG